jgi:hypothetical protein
MIYIYLFETLLVDIKEVLSEGIRARQRVASEINPLRQKGRDNPIKKLVREFRRAKRKPTESNVTASKLSHKIGVLYADHVGLPRLVNQIERHVKKIPKPKIKLDKKSKNKKQVSKQDKTDKTPPSKSKSPNPPKNTP